MSSLVFFSKTSIKQVYGAGGTISILQPIGENGFAWNQTYPISWEVTADSGYEIVSVQTKENDVVIRTDYPNPRIPAEKTHFEKNWYESNPGLGPNKITVCATFTKNFNFYYETEYQYFDSVGTIYKECFNSIGNWTLKTYDNEGESVNREGYYGSGCSGGIAWVLETIGYSQEDTFALLVDIGISLSGWSKYGDIKIRFRHNSSSDSASTYCTNTFVYI
ncbi:MAG: hypothetical protein ACTSP3_09785 [Candidatus Heimdallarchaeaceae archaeon]